MAGIGHEEDGFDVTVELLVHRRHLEFELEVGDRPQAAHDDRGADLAGEMHGQPFEGQDLNLGHGAQRRHGFLHDGDPLLQRE